MLIFAGVVAMYVAGLVPVLQGPLGTVQTPCDGPFSYCGIVVVCRCVSCRVMLVTAAVY